MELDEESLDGHWSTDVKSGMDFFIINDAIFSKLCILGEDVEPCFEGASVTAPKVSSSFSKVDNDFKQTLYTMMQDLKFALEGGKDMEMENKEVIEETAVEMAEETETTETSIDTETTSTEESAEETPITENSEDESSEAEESEEVTEEDGEETPSEEKSNEEESAEETSIEEAIAETETEVTEDAAASEEFSLEDYNTLKASYSELETKYNELLAFKNQVELKEKEELINGFYMLSEDDKKDVREHISEYSKDEIEAKLSVICVRNKVNFDSEDKAKNENNVEEEITPVTTFNIKENESSIPAWISACINTQNSKN